jgi:hypothetical protein
MGAAAIGAIAAPVVGGIVGHIAGAGDRAEARNRINQAAAAYNIPVPELEQLLVQYEAPELAGLLSNISETAEQMAPSAMERVQIDPRLKQAQMSALQRLSQLGTTPLTEVDKAAISDVRRQVAGDEQARQKAIMQEMAARGQAGDGQELAARLLSSQASTNRAQQMAQQQMAQAQSRALDAISRSGALGGEMGQQDFSRQAQVAQARDAINQFNAAQRMGVQQRNIAAQRDVQGRNLGLQQERLNQLAQARNRSRESAANAAANQFNMMLGRAGGQAGALTNAAQMSQNQGIATGSMFSNIGTGVATGILGAASAKKEGLF